MENFRRDFTEPRTNWHDSSWRLVSKHLLLELLEQRKEEYFLGEEKGGEVINLIDFLCIA